VNNLCIFQPLGSRTLTVPENSINVLPVVDVRDVLRPAHELRRDQLQPDSHADYIFEQGQHVCDPLMPNYPAAACLFVVAKLT
jgi:hypothetical protein